MESFDLTPSPRVLLALAQTAMKPIDALCELVDNSIDSFRNADKDSGNANEIYIEIPTQGELRGDRYPLIKIFDNGPGMTPDDARNALTAGYSSKEQLDNWGDLGLFGVGLNIATAKFARKTRLITATKDSDTALIVDLDLSSLMGNKNFVVNPKTEPKQNYFNPSGSVIEISERWPAGDANHDFPKRLIQNGPGRIREMLGRRYATYLRPDSLLKFKIFVNGVSCEPFEHCHWAEHRSVPYGVSGRRIKAMEKIDRLIRSSERCAKCRGEIKDGQCVADNNHSGSERVDERVRGWIGVQRYDDTSHYGIDLIRNGRAIRILEKDAFFTFRDEGGNEIRDYPADGTYGRIVGEIHLDHVPVNFTKEDFQRTTYQWQEAMAILRGNSSLQSRQPGAAENDTPMMRIYTGYRRVRKAGIPDLYMAELYEDNDGIMKTKRISRDIEDEFYEKFLAKEKGYHNDEKWFERVNVSVPTDTYEDCPNPECDAQNPSLAEECQICGELLKSKKCIKCEEKILWSAESCKHCGISQVPEGPWKCNVCGKIDNSPEMHECGRCSAVKGAVNPFDINILMENSQIDDVLSISDIEIELPGSGKSDKFNLEVRHASLRNGQIHIPAVVFPDMPMQKITVFLDKKHSLFGSLQMRLYYAVAEVAADFVHAGSTHILSSGRKNEHNLINLTFQILNKYWGEQLSDNKNQVQDDIKSLLENIQEGMVDYLMESAPDIFQSMSNAERTAMVSNMQESGIDIGKMEKLKESGEFMRHIPPSVVVAIFNEYTEIFFDKRIWNPPWNIPAVPEETASAIQKETKQIYCNCLEDCINFLRYQRSPSSVVVRRARLSLEFLEKELAG